MFQDNELVNFQFVCMINLNSILATYPEWGQKVPPLSLFGGEKRPQNSKMAPFCAPVFEIWNLNKITMKSEHKKWWQKAPSKS